MKLRISLILAIVVAALLIVAVAALLGSPRRSYIRHATSAYASALALWNAAGPTSYTAVVVSNSLTQPSGGHNTIHVQGGVLVSAQNPRCPECEPSDFAGLTIDSLFQRIARECLHDFPTQFCNVAYDQTLGFPVRIDTYPYNLKGQERPSVTVESVIVHPAE